MAGNNPVFGKIDKALREQQYAGFGQAPQQGYPQQGYPQQGYPQQGYPQQQPGYYPPPPMSADQLEQMYQQPSAGPVATGRVTYDDVIMRTLTLFAVLLVSGGISWVATSARPSLTMPIWLGGMFAGLAVGFAISFMKKVSVPLILTYAVLEGAFLGAFSRYIESVPSYRGIVPTAVIATLCTFAGMFIAYRAGVVRVTSKSRRIFGMMAIGYALFSLVNVVALLAGWTHGWGFGGSSMLGIGLSILGVGLASYSLAVDFDSVDSAVRMGAPQQFSWLLGHGLIVSLVWLYIEIVRLLARLRD